MNNRLRTEQGTAQLVRGFEAQASEASVQPSLFSPAELPARLWTLDEVAEFLQMSKDWVRDHATRRQPRIPSIRLGGRRAVLRFRPQDVRQFIDEHFRPGGSE
jgi:predicted DNA-binding transcriptional regulator AlpA